MQSSLRGGVATLIQELVVTNETLLLLEETPNCNLYQSQVNCSTGSMGGDVKTWGRWLVEMGFKGTWGVWDAVDGGAAQVR